MLATSCASLQVQNKQKKRDYVVKVYTEFGIIHLLLFDETPKHKENFLQLAANKFYDSTTFHRVLEGFVVQGGDPNSKPEAAGPLGKGGPGYEIEAEIVEGLEHDRGVLAAARQGDVINPERKSSGSQFYIVQSEEGAHHLDGAYTIFGKVLKGMEVVDRIAEQQVKKGGVPTENIYMTMQVVKLKTKKIDKLYNIDYNSFMSIPLNKEF